MCARCRNEGGEVDFTALPKRKKKGRPVMVSAYIPTEEDERLALEMDRMEPPTANFGRSTDVQLKSNAMGDKFIGDEGNSVSISVEAAVDVPSLMLTTSAISDDAQLGQAEEQTIDQTIEQIDAVSPTYDNFIGANSLSLRIEQAKSILVIQRSVTPEWTTETDYSRWTENLLVQMKQIFDVWLVRTHSTEASVLQRLVEEQLASIDGEVKAATNAPERTTADATTMTNTGHIEKESHSSIGMHLCCVGLPIHDALSIWQHFPNTFNTFIIIDPSEQRTSKVNTNSVSTMLSNKTRNQQLTAPSKVRDKFNAAASLVPNAVFNYLLPTAQLSLPYLMKLPLIRVFCKLTNKVWKFSLRRTDQLQSANRSIAQDDVVNGADSLQLEEGLEHASATRDDPPPYKLVYSPYRAAQLSATDTRMSLEQSHNGVLYFYGAEAGRDGTNYGETPTLPEVNLCDLF